MLRRAARKFLVARGRRRRPWLPLAERVERALSVTERLVAHLDRMRVDVRRARPDTATARAHAEADLMIRAAAAGGLRKVTRWHEHADPLLLVRRPT